MGIRPRMSILVGIDDAKDDDVRFTPPDEEWLEELLNFRKLTEDECWKEDDGAIFNDFIDTNREIQDMVFNPRNYGEFSIKGVIGIYVEKGKYDTEFLRALAALDVKYMQPGSERIPTLDPERHNMLYRHCKYTEEDVKANRFVGSVFENMPAISRMHWQRAQHYLKLVGWDVPETDLRYLFVWNWS